MKEEPILVYMKSAEPKTRKMTIPKAAIEKIGYKFYMKIYKDKVVLQPIEGE